MKDNRFSAARPVSGSHRMLYGRPSAWLRLAVTSIALVLIASACGSSHNSSSSTVSIGLPYPSGLQALAAAFGGALGPSGATPPSDQQVQAFYQADVNYVNSHGGLLGRNIKPIYYAVSATSPSTAASEQAECTNFTQDHHVFAVMALPNHSTTLISCLQSANVITFDPAGGIPLDDTAFSQFPLYASAGGLSLTRVAEVEVNALFQQGFFGSGPKVGLVSYNSQPFTRAIDQGLIPALASHGLQLDDRVSFNPVESIRDVAPMQAAINSAVLRFKTEGIDHVLFMDILGAAVQPFVTAESAQNYYPRLGMTSNENPGARAYAGNTQDKNQIKQFSSALAIGWDPPQDLAKPPLNATGTVCSGVMTAAGASAAQATYFESICDQLLGFQAAVNAGGKLDPTSALSGLAKATNIPSAELVGSPDYSGGRRDGVAVGQLLDFSTSCQCFQYSSSPFQLSSLENT